MLTRLEAFLTRPKVLWVLFALLVIETLAFGVIMRVWEFMIIDEMSDPQAILKHVNAMTDLQRSVHAWMTATLDVAYR
ncbi:MAG: hypothetical protein AAF513_04050 [Pseudomonadota bacterium]